MDSVQLNFSSNFSTMGAEDPVTMSSEFMHLFEGIFFVFWCITVPLYAFLLFIMTRAQYNKVLDLATPFFQICIAASIIDLVTLLNNYFGAVFPKWGWCLSFYMAMGQPYLKMYFYIAWGTGICQAISVSVLATNRLFAMMSPENYTRYWTGRPLKMAISLQFLLGMLISVPNFFTDVNLIPTDDGVGLVPKIINKPTSKLYFTVGGVFLALNSLYLIGAYIYLYITLRKIHQEQIEMSSTSRAERTRTEAKRREHRLFLMSTCIVIVQLTILTFFGTFVFPIAKLTTEQFYMLYNALSDFYSGINAYLLLIFSDALRAYIKKLFSCYNVDTVATSVVSFRPLRSRKSTPHSTQYGKSSATAMEQSGSVFSFFFEGAFFVLFCITVPLYIFLITVLIKAQINRVTDLASPFFQICITASILDLVTLLNNYFGAVFPKWGWWSSFYISMGEPYLKTYFYLAWGTGICQGLSVSIMATNRLYAMLNPENYTRFWKSWRLKVAIILQIFIGMTGSLTNFFSDVGFVATDDGRGLIPKITNKSTSKLYFTIAGTFLGVNCLYLIVAYAYLYSVVRKRHQHQLRRSSTVKIEKTRSEVKRREQRLFIMSTCIVIVQLAIVCFSGIFIFPISHITTDQFYMLYNALSDLYSGINAYLLLGFSDALRAYIRKLLGFHKKDATVQSFVSTRIQQSQPQTPQSPVVRESSQ